MTELTLPAIYTDLSPSERRLVREEYTRLQNGLCFYCDRPLHGDPSKKVRSTKVNYKLFPPTMFKYPVHLQHDHSTGLTEGAVHARCNAVMWQYEGR